MMISNDPYLYYRKFKNIIVYAVMLCCTIIALLPLFLIIEHLIDKGLNQLTWSFFTETTKPIGQKDSGMANAILGTIYICLLASIIAIPIGVFCGTYSAEFKNEKLSKLLRVFNDTLIGAPSIVIGIFAYLLIVVPLKSFSFLAGAIAISIIIMPVIIRSTEEILKLTGNHIREAGLALGINRYQVIFFIIFKGALSGVITGIILALSRAIGETAPLLFTAFGNNYISHSLFEPISSLPVRIYNYAISPFEEWQNLAWTGCLVLVMFVLSLNLLSRLIIKSR